MDIKAYKLFIKYFSRALMLLLVMPIINSARGLVAKKMGDDTSEREGRITLNPLAHLDPIGSLMILLIGLGWSKPMPIQFSRMKRQRLGIILVSLAGPLTHFLSAIVCKMINTGLDIWAGDKLADDTITPLGAFSLILILISNINVSLGVINLLPLPPMDGFILLYQFAGYKFHSWYHANYQIINQVSTLILFALFFCGDLTGDRFDPLGWLILFADMGLSIIAHLPFLLLALAGVIK
jgi:Zn-dependent protease